MNKEKEDISIFQEGEKKRRPVPNKIFAESSKVDDSLVDANLAIKKDIAKGKSKKKKIGEGAEEDIKGISVVGESSELMEKVIAINRITKVTKGGKNMSFSVLAVVGDRKGRVGYSLSKSKEVATAIRKAMASAKKNMVTISLKGKTIPHQIIGKCSGSRVLLKPAGEGTGVIASGPVRAVCDGAGIHDILTKVHRSNNPINVVKAAMDGLNRLKTEQKV